MGGVDQRRVLAVLASLAVALLLASLVFSTQLASGYSSAELPYLPAGTTSGFMVLGSAVLAFWGASSFFRCTDSTVRRNLLVICVALTAWMLVALVREATSSQTVAMYCWYAYSIPLTLVPLVVLFNTFRVASLEHGAAFPLVRVALIVCGASIVCLFMTNGAHHLVVTAAGDTAVARGVILGWNIALFAASLVMVVVRSHGKARVVVGLVAAGAVLAALYGIAVVAGADLQAGGDIVLPYSVFSVVLLEACLRAGILPSSRNFDAVFAKLPFDLKILTPARDALYRTLRRTDVASPLLAAEKEQLVDLQIPRGQVQEFKVASMPDRIYKAYRVRGRIALLSEDATLINKGMLNLESRRKLLEQQVDMLEQTRTAQQRLRRQKREQELFEDVESSLRSATTAIQALIDSLPADDTPDGREKRKHQLFLVKLLVAYCKRKGSLVLATEGDADFDRDRLMVIVNEMVADLRTAGVECAAMVEVAHALPAHIVNLFYDCLYDFVTIAFQYPSPLVMISIRTEGPHAVLRVHLECETDADLVENPLVDRLEKRFAGDEDAFDLSGEEGSLRLKVQLAAGEEV